MKAARCLALCAAILLALTGPSHALGGGHGGGHGSAHSSARGSGHASGIRFASLPFLGRYRAYVAYGPASSGEEACELDGQLWGDRVCVAESPSSWPFWAGVVVCVAAALERLLPD